MKKILIDSSLTGGRGPAKKTFEFIQYCRERDIEYRLLTNTAFLPKLSELNIKPDYTIDVRLSDDTKTILQTYEKKLRKISFDALVRFGARVPGPRYAKGKGIPYVIVDGGLPDRLDSNTSLYEKNTYKNAKKYIVTSQFPWKIPFEKDLKNIQVGFFTLSNKTKQFVRNLRLKNNNTIVRDYLFDEKSLSAAVKNKTMLVNLMMTSNYIADPYDRITYGAWLKTTEYDSCIGFVRRLATDLALQTRTAALFVDTGIKPLVSDIESMYPNLAILSFENGWSYLKEIAIQKIATVNISRATNYQPFVALLGNGSSITTPVPTDGYMNEDTAAYQYQAFGMTEVIEYDDEYYVYKLLQFIQDKTRQNKIAKNQIRVSETFLSKYNSADLVAQALNLNKHL